MAQQMNLPTIGGFNPNELKARFDNWVKEQHPAVEIAVTTLGAATQGVFIGYLLGSFSALDPNQGPNAAETNPQVAAQLSALQKGGPWGQARNLGVMTGVNAGLTLAIKKYRKGKEDVWGSMLAAFGAGAAFSLVSGVPNPLQAALTTGIAFAGFNGLFYQVGKAFSPEHEDTEYTQGKYLLHTLGLQKYGNNLKKGQLTDNTIMLWNDRALADVRIPAGPRLLILHHLDTYRNPGSILKPALPLPRAPAAPVPQPQQPMQQQTELERWVDREGPSQPRIVLRVSNEAEFSALQQLIQWVYTRSLPDGASQQLLLTMLQLANRFSIHACAVACGAALQPQQLTWETVKQLLLLPPFYHDNELFDGLMMKARHKLHFKLGDLEVAWADPLLRRSILQLPFKGVALLLGSQDTCVCYENTALVVASAWLAQHGDSMSAEDQKTLAELLVVPAITPLFAASVAMQMPWLVDALGVGTLAAGIAMVGVIERDCLMRCSCPMAAGCCWHCLTPRLCASSHVPGTTQRIAYTCASGRSLLLMEQRAGGARTAGGLGPSQTGGLLALPTSCSSA